MREAPGFSVVRTAVVESRLKAASTELPRQPRVPRESHLRSLPTAAHTYSQNWSRITSISASDLPLWTGRKARAMPSRRGD